MRITIQNTFRSFDLDDIEQDSIFDVDPEYFYGSHRSVGVHEAATIECLSYLDTLGNISNIDELTIGSLSRSKAMVSGIRSENDVKRLRDQLEDSKTKFVSSVDIESTTTGDRWRLILETKTAP